MQKRHENSLDDMLEKVAFEGFASIAKWRLSRWYGQERFTVGIRRDIRTRWDELASELSFIDGKSLSFAEVKDQILMIADHKFIEDEE